MNYQRRTFRGRGGPTDRRLPKHNAARRKPHIHLEESGEKVCTTDQQQHDLPKEVVHGNDTMVASINNQEESVIGESDSGSFVSSEQHHGRQEGHMMVNPRSAECKQIQKEIKHLQKRVSNIQEAMQQSKSISSPSVYEANVLNAVSNCVNEWRAIVIHWEDYIQLSINEEAVELEACKHSGAVSVFGLIQFSLQCGPLTGSKAGYFKRCGSDVAKMALLFLEAIVHDSPHAERLGFTEKQIKVIEQWKCKARDAVSKGKPPSKSQQKHQQKNAKGKGKRNR